MKEVDKAAFGRRVAQRREKLGMAQDALARAVGMKQQGVDNIEHGVVARPRLLREIAATLRTTEDWLLWRRGPEEVEAIPGAQRLEHVSLLSWVSAGKLADAESQIPVEDVHRMVFADLGPGEFFALRVEGDSMDRRCPDGSVIVVNKADREPVAGKPYVFWHRTEGTTFKLWQPDPDRLEPHSWNDANKPIYIKRKSDFAVIGRVKRSVLDL